MAVSPSGRFAASGHVNVPRFTGGGIVVWDLERRKALGRYESRMGVSAVAFSPDEAKILVAGRSPRVRVLRRDDGTVVNELALCDHCWGFEGAFTAGGAEVVVFGGTLESPGHDGEPETRVWDLKTGRVVRTFARSAAAVAQDGAVAIERRGILWNLSTGRDVTARQPPRDADWSVRALASDGRRALLSSLSANIGPVGLWDPANGSEVDRLSGHSAQVRAGAFTGDGRRVVTGAGEKRNGWQDCTVRLWDTSSGREVAAHDRHQTGVTAVATSPDGSRIVSGDVDGSVVLWEV
jgi:WD40 repeat protein